MTKPKLSDEILMAYADGELDSETSRAVEVAMQADSSVADRVALFGETKHILKQAALARSEAPLPQPLKAKIDRAFANAETAPEVIVPLRQRRKTEWQPLALAASIALAIGLGGGLLLSRTLTPQTTVADLAVLSTSVVRATLNDLPSGAERHVAGGVVRAIASFRDADGTLCREFEFDGSARAHIAVACHSDDTWVLRFAVIADVASGGYAPASSHDALDAYLVSIDAGPPLSAESEADSLSALAR
ncbi:anti-sigma factor family protein [Celeribacter persicus]|jgi:Predicted transmembrane transcriptional regulator (anti-sigma factor)|uniref:Anti-sigma factor RsiW n=1 Tax=Celeribacter persicus TaxID=1651082 RepID=A0A2T5HSQ2_9RHOB|nr:anti-sigma factor [Celeribacter persicus]PTQ74602.1 hypothetical protein C8N42_104247 [Celeribacter persicus]